LHAINRAQAAVFARPLVPDGAATFLQPFDIAVAAQKPQQLDNDGSQKDLFGGHQRKTFVQVKTHLVAKNAAGAGTGTVTFLHARGVHMAHKVFILAADGAGRGVHGRQVYQSPGLRGFQVMRSSHRVAKTKLINSNRTQGMTQLRPTQVAIKPRPAGKTEPPA